MQGKSPPMQVEKPNRNLDMVNCWLSSCNPECTKYIPDYNVREGKRQYIVIDR